MVLSKNYIQNLINNSELVVKPKYDLKEASIKAYLSGEFGKTKDSYTEMNEFHLEPKGFILAKAKEILTLPKNVCAFYDGYVGVASQGLFTHGSSMFIDPGETSQITLELFNASDIPIKLEKDMRVGQYIFFELS